LGILRIFVSEFGASTRQTDRQTEDGRTDKTRNAADETAAC